MDNLIDFLNRYPVVLGDGAMGTMLQKAGLTTGGSPEEWNVSHADVVRGIYQGYVDAGSQVITTNSFGGNRFRLALHNYEGRVCELNRAAAALAREVADGARAQGHEVFVAGSVGPTGEILQPLGLRAVEEVREAYAEQAAALDQGGVDFFLVETMSALEEIQAAIEGIRLGSARPVAATMTFDTRLHTMMGVSPEQALTTLYDLGVRVLGANCGNGPEETETVIKQMLAVKPDDVFLIVQSNAGLPKWANKQIHYDGTPEVMADYAVQMRAAGVKYIGACCGSTPEHIAAMRAALAG
jgi:5-methyltetrahydrofolate--homocysteine methyltransferase